MKKAIASLLGLIMITILFVNGKQKKPIKWTSGIYNAYEIGDTIQINFTGKLEKGWYLYSSDSDSSKFVSPAKLVTVKNNTVTFLGGIRALNSIERFDEALKSKVRVMEDEANFQQTVIVKHKPIQLDATLEYVLVRMGETEGWLLNLIEKFKKEYK